MSFLEKLTGPSAKDSAPKAMTNPQEEKGHSKSGGWTSEAEGQLAVDVFQTPTDIFIKSTIAGVKPEDLDIAITNDMVTVRGHRRSESDLAKDDYFYQECYWGPFSRSVILPVDVETTKSVATLKNGVLTIKLPKAEKLKTKKIEIAHHEE